MNAFSRRFVACLLGIDGRPQAVSIDGPVLGLDAVLENRVLFGSVNAHHQDWLAAVDRFGIVSERAVLLDVLSVVQNLAVPFTLEIEPPLPWTAGLV